MWARPPPGGPATNVIHRPPCDAGAAIFSPGSGQLDKRHERRATDKLVRRRGDVTDTRPGRCRGEEVGAAAARAEPGCGARWAGAARPGVLPPGRRNRRWGAREWALVRAGAAGGGELSPFPGPARAWRASWRRRRFP
ncbi:hypothetical protein ACRRTK_012537 [Alexandromys fortis]